MKSGESYPYLRTIQELLTQYIGLLNTAQQLVGNIQANGLGHRPRRGVFSRMPPPCDIASANTEPGP
jgi:hypothetical protein